MLCGFFVFFFKQKTAYEMRISDWSSDVCSSDLGSDAFFNVNTPAEIAILASQGYAQVTVYAALKAGILTTGDELVSPGQPRADEHIYNSNGPMLAALVQNMGVSVVHVLHAQDTPESLQEEFSVLLQDCDLILTVGGVSVGGKDLVKQIGRAQV